MESIAGGKPKRNIISVVANYLDKLLVWVSIILGAGLTINMIVAVVFRYVLSKPIFWADELSLFLFCWLTFLGGSLAVKRSDLAAVTILFDRLSGKLKLAASMFIQITVLFFSSVVAYYSYKWITSPSVLNQFSATIPVKLWILYLIVPVSMVCIGIFSIDHIIRYLVTGKVEQGEETHP